MWIPITLAAATFQVLRTSRQHRLRSVLSVNGAGFVRYAYGCPLAVIAVVMTFGIVGDGLPAIPWRFWPITAGAGAVQIIGTLALLQAFELRDFAIGTVYAKTVSGPPSSGFGTEHLSGPSVMTHIRSRG